MKIKKFLAPLMAVSLVAGAMPVVNVSAENKPNIYVDFTYEDDGDIRADIMFENVPDVSCGGFHVEFGDGWKLKIKSNGKLDASVIGCDSNGTASVSSVKHGDNDLFVCFGTDSSHGYDLNGRFYSIYLEKSKNFNSNNATANVVFKSYADADDMLVSDNEYIIYSGNNHLPVMLGAYEYIIGDVNNDGRVNVIDASQLMSALHGDRAQNYIVDNIKNTYKSLFPYAVCAAAPDADQDGSINYIDVDLIMEYYADMSTEQQNNTRIGKRDIYELFND